jgi:hypothetical protein
MRFLFNLMNHGKLGQRSLEDVIGIIGHQLRALGHEAVWRESNDGWLPAGAGYNVLVEGTTDEFVEIVAQGYAQGSRYLLVATEEPTPRTWTASCRSSPENT